MTTPPSPTRLTVRHALAHGFHTVLEGILCFRHYGGMPAGLLAGHPGRTHCYSLDVPFEETLARHATKPIADEVTEDQLREWFTPLDLLPGGVETVVPAASALEETVDRVLHESGLRAAPCAQVRPKSAPAPTS